MNRISLTSVSPLDTEQLGVRLGSLLKPGMLLALRGGLGGGKTCFTRGVVAGAAPASADMVASPTFAIMNEYPGNPPLFHFDFYRLNSEHEIAELGFEDYFHGNGISIVEWPERLGQLLPDDHLSITFELAGDDQRIITFEAFGSRSASVLKQFENQEA